MIFYFLLVDNDDFDDGNLFMLIMTILVCRTDHDHDHDHDDLDHDSDWYDIYRDDEDF